MESCETRGAMPRVVVVPEWRCERRDLLFVLYVGRAWCEREDFEEASGACFVAVWVAHTVVVRPEVAHENLPYSNTHYIRMYLCFM